MASLIKDPSQGGFPWKLGLVGDIGQYEHIWRTAYGRGPEGIIVSLAERIG